jgi:hypothetical protein
MCVVRVDGGPVHPTHECKTAGIEPAVPLDLEAKAYASFAACSRVAWKVSFGQRSWVRRRFTPEVAR